MNKTIRTVVLPLFIAAQSTPNQYKRSNCENCEKQVASSSSSTTSLKTQPIKNNFPTAHFPLFLYYYMLLKRLVLAGHTAHKMPAKTFSHLLDRAVCAGAYCTNCNEWCNQDNLLLLPLFDCVLQPTARARFFFFFHLYICVWSNFGLYIYLYVMLLNGIVAWAWDRYHNGNSGYILDTFLIHNSSMKQLKKCHKILLVNQKIIFTYFTFLRNYVIRNNTWCISTTAFFFSNFDYIVVIW